MRWRSSIHALRPSGGLAAPFFGRGISGDKKRPVDLDHIVVQKSDVVQMEGLLQRDELS